MCVQVLSNTLNCSVQLLVFKKDKLSLPVSHSLSSQWSILYMRFLLCGCVRGDVKLRYSVIIIIITLGDCFSRSVWVFCLLFQALFELVFVVGFITVRWVHVEVRYSLVCSEVVEHASREMFAFKSVPSFFA